MGEKVLSHPLCGRTSYCDTILFIITVNTLLKFFIEMQLIIKDIKNNKLKEIKRC